MLHPSGTVLRQAVCVEQGPSEMCYLVVPDAVVDNLRSASDALPWLSLLNVNYRQGLDAQKAGDMLRGAIGQVSPVDDEYAELGWVYKSDYWPVSIDLSKQEAIADSMSARVLITYLAVYIGFVLLPLPLRRCWPSSNCPRRAIPFLDIARWRNSAATDG